MIYLDNAATTKLNSEVKETLDKLYDEYFINADSPYFPGVKVHDLQEKARTNIANMINVESNELIFTSCGSESNNLAIKGIAFKYLNKGTKHIITSLTEHSSVYETMKQLEHFGFEVTYLKPNKYGEIEKKDILESIKDNTILISIMKINSELGSINKLEDIYKEIKNINSNIVVHSDCVQALGKYDLDLINLDLASFSAHKINGVKGSGLLYKKKGISLLPLITGGQQEFNLRAGTSNYHYNIVLSKTLRLFLESRDEEFIKNRYDYCLDLLEKDERIKINSRKNDNSMYIINFSIIDYKPEVILNALEREEIYLSTKSACSSNAKRSRIMDSLPIDNKNKDTAFRLSFDLNTSLKEIEVFYKTLDKILNSIEKG